MKEWSYTSSPPMSRTACTETQCLYKVHFTFTFFKMTFVKGGSFNMVYHKKINFTKIDGPVLPLSSDHSQRLAEQLRTKLLHSGILSASCQTRSLTCLTLILLTWGIWWAPNNASRWQMEFNLAFKGLNSLQYSVDSGDYTAVFRSWNSNLS
jgi:hypothetical protein